MINFQRRILFLVVFSLGALVLSSEEPFFKESFFEGEGATPERGFVPDEETAIKIAEAVWIPIYGKSIRKRKPFRAILVDDEIWIVKGTLKKGLLGGVPYIKIRKDDGTILKVTHTA